jgi:hypothetical protein
MTFAVIHPLVWPVRSVANGLGIAWWARVETKGPDVVYWFGPFVRQASLDAALPAVLDELRSESPASLQFTLRRARRQEPFTETPGS